MICNGYLRRCGKKKGSAGGITNECNSATIITALMWNNYYCIDVDAEIQRILSNLFGLLYLVIISIALSLTENAAIVLIAHNLKSCC